MELIEGETLAARVRRDGPLNAKEALKIAIQIARALMAAAAHDLIHRDLKPSNIMLTGDVGGENHRFRPGQGDYRCRGRDGSDARRIRRHTDFRQP